MKVTELLHEAVFTKPGSYVARPGVSSSVRIWLRSPALIVPSVMGIWYSLPVLLSRTVRVLVSPVSVTSAPCVRRCGSRWQFGGSGEGRCCGTMPTSSLLSTYAHAGGGDQWVSF